MSLENQLSELNKSISELIKVICNDNVCLKKSTLSNSNGGAKDGGKVKEEIKVRVVSHEDIQELAKLKMKLPNVDKNDIKKIVRGVKKDAQISDLNPEELILTYDNISKLK